MPSDFLRGEFLYHPNEFVIALVALGLFLVATEIGFRGGRAVKDRLADVAKSQSMIARRDNWNQP